MTNKSLTLQDVRDVAKMFNVPPAALYAVRQVEAPFGGFLKDGRPVILFEAHRFDALTNGRFRKSHPALSSASWDRSLYARGATPDIRSMREHDRLAVAATLDRDAALKAASWGAFQILGSNHKQSGFNTLQEFINAMYRDERAQLIAAMNFIRNLRIDDELRRGDWAGFARVYNGPAYAKNEYDKKLSRANAQAQPLFR